MPPPPPPPPPGAQPVHAVALDAPLTWQCVAPCGTTTRWPSPTPVAPGAISPPLASKNLTSARTWLGSSSTFTSRPSYAILTLPDWPTTVKSVSSENVDLHATTRRPAPATTRIAHLLRFESFISTSCCGPGLLERPAPDNPAAERPSAPRRRSPERSAAQPLGAMLDEGPRSSARRPSDACECTTRLARPGGPNSRIFLPTIRPCRAGRPLVSSRHAGAPPSARPRRARRRAPARAALLRLAPVHRRHAARSARAR